MMVRKLYVIIGDPIGQARSPHVFNTLFARRGIDAEMISLEASSERFAALLDGLRFARNFGGAVITLPHKIAAAKLAHEKSKRVCIAGAANVLKPASSGWSADLFDGEGFAAGLTAQGFAITNRKAAIVGAGGAGLAIAAALLEGGISTVALHDRDSQKVAFAIARLSQHYPERVISRPPRLADDLVINATPMGMAPDDSLPIDLESLRSGVVVADAIMKPAVTRLLSEASRRGHPICEGHHMLDGQVEAIWNFLAMGEG
ncbi:MAG: shikimate dehydrogenase [Parvibaculaceae bacterium]